MAKILLSFVDVIPAPPLGYVVKYKQMHHVLFTTLTPNGTNSPIEIDGVPAGKKWEGTIQAQMDTSTLCAPVRWTIDDSANAMTKFIGRVSTTQVGICSEPEQSLYSNGVVADGPPVIGAVVYFDFDGLVGIGNGYIVGSDNKVYQVVDSEVVSDTGLVCA